MDEWLCSSTHNKDNVEALDKCAPLAGFISFVPFSNQKFVDFHIERVGEGNISAQTSIVTMQECGLM